MGFKQDSVIKLILTDDNFISDMRDYLEPRFFESEIIENIVSFAFDYFDLYRTAPKRDILLQLEKFLKKQDIDVATDYEVYISNVMALDAERTRYIDDYVTSFAKEARIKALFIDGFELVDRGHVDRALDLINKFNKTLPTQDIGDLCYTDAITRTYMSKLDGGVDCLFRSGIKALDCILQHPFSRRQLGVVVGPSKSGKSWFLMDQAVRATLNGFKVVHISHENDVEDLELRYDQMLTRTTKHPSGRLITYVERNEFGEVVRNDRSIYRESIYNCDTTLEKRRILRKCGGELRIKKYPMCKATFFDTLRYLDTLENRFNFVPDVVIQDYPDIMCLPGKEELRNKLNEIYMQHKQLADERNILCLVASQTTKLGFSQQFITKDAIAEDYRKLANCDFAIGICRDQDQGKFGVTNLYVMANRNGRDNMGCSIQQNLESGFFSTASWLDPDTRAFCYGDEADF
jgi:hypothetical protein